MEPAAGRQLFAISDVQPQITFEDWRAAKGRSIIAPDGTRRSAWVERATDSTGATSHCTVWYDPAYFDTTGLDAWVLATRSGTAWDSSLRRPTRTTPPIVVS